MDKVYVLTLTSNNDEYYEDAQYNNDEFIGIFSSIKKAKSYVETYIENEKYPYRCYIDDHKKFYKNADPEEFISDYKEEIDKDGAYSISFNLPWWDPYEMRNFCYEIKETEVDGECIK